MRNLEQVLKEIDNPKLDIVVYDDNRILLKGNAQKLLMVASQKFKDLKVITELYHKDFIEIKVQSSPEELIDVLLKLSDCKQTSEKDIWVYANNMLLFTGKAKDLLTCLVSDFITLEVSRIENSEVDINIYLAATVELKRGVVR